MGMTRAADRTSASVFVVDDTTAPGNRILWVAGLVGGCIACPWQNSFVVYRRGLRTPRHLWISPGFAARSPATAGIIGALVRGERWHTHATLGNFRAQIERTAPARRSTLLGLATSGEINEMAAPARIFTESGILHLIVVPYMKRSLVGAGR